MNDPRFRLNPPGWMKPTKAFDVLSMDGPIPQTIMAAMEGYTTKIEGDEVVTRDASGSVVGFHSTITESPWTE